MSTNSIPEFVHCLAGMAYARMDNDPASLLAVPGLPSVGAELYFAQLIGLDDELIDFVRLPRVEPDLRLPIRTPIRWRYEEPDVWPMPELRVARYVPMYYVLTLDLSMGAIRSDVWDYLGQPNPTTHLWRLAFLRYRREQ